MRIARPQSAQVAMSQFPCELESAKVSRKQLATQKMENSQFVKVETQKYKETTIGYNSSVLSSQRKSIRQFLDTGGGLNYKNSEMSFSTTSFLTSSQSSQALNSIERHQSAASFWRMGRQEKEQQGSIYLGFLGKDKQGDNEELNELTKATDENLVLRVKLQRGQSRERQLRKKIEEKEECDRQLLETRQQIVQVEKEIREIIEKLRESEKMRTDSQKQAEISINLKNELQQSDLKINFIDKLRQKRGGIDVEKIISQEELRVQKENRFLNQRMSNTERDHHTLKEDYTLMMELHHLFEEEQTENEILQIQLASLTEKLEHFELANEQTEAIPQSEEFQLIANQNSESKSKLQEIQAENKQLMDLIAAAQGNCNDISKTSSMEDSTSLKLFRFKKSNKKQMNLDRRSQESLFPKWMQQQVQPSSNSQQPLNRMSSDSQIALQTIKNSGRKATNLKKSNSSSNNQTNSTLQLIRGNNNPNSMIKTGNYVKPLPETTPATPVRQQQPPRGQFFMDSMQFNSLSFAKNDPKISKRYTQINNSSNISQGNLGQDQGNLIGNDKKGKLFLGNNNKNGESSENNNNNNNRKIKTQDDSSKLDITSNSRDQKEDDYAKKQEKSASLTQNLLVNDKNKKRKLVTATSLQNFNQQKNLLSEENILNQDRNHKTSRSKPSEGLPTIIGYSDSEREAFVSYCMSGVDFETKQKQYESMISKQEYLVFPNPCNFYMPIVLSAPLNQIAQQLFSFDYKLYVSDLKKLRMKTSLKIQEQIMEKLFSNDTKIKDNNCYQSSKGKTMNNSSFSSNSQLKQPRQQTHYFLPEQQTLSLSQVLKDPEILRILSFNPTSIPEQIISQIQLTSSPQSLGEGKCYRGVLSLTNQRCSLIEYPIFSIQQLKAILQSQQITSSITSPFLLRPIFTYLQQNQNIDNFQMNAIYSPLLMTLTSFLNSFSVTISARLKICFGISLGVLDLHRNYFIHTNLQTDTIILNETLTPLIAGLQETNIQQLQSGQFDFSIDLIALGNMFKQVLLESSKGGYPSFVQEKQIKGIIDACNRPNESVQNIIMKLQELLTEEDLQEIKRIQGQLFKLPQNENAEDQEQENNQTSYDHTLFESARLCSSQNQKPQQHTQTSDEIKLGRLFRASTEEQLECTMAMFQIDQVVCSGSSMLLRQGEDSIQYMRSENDGNLYVDEGINAQELVRCQLLNGLPIITRELEDEFIEVITEGNHIPDSCASSSQGNVIRFDGFEGKECFVDLSKRKVKLIDSIDGSEIEYSPLKIRSRRHHKDAWLVETGRSCSLKMVECAVSITLPNINSKERFNASSSNFYCELVNINPTYLLTLVSKNPRKDTGLGTQSSKEIDTSRQTSSLTAMFDSQFGLTTFLPKKNAILISDIIIKGGCLGLAIDAENSQVFFGIFVSTENPLMMNGFRITKDQLIPIQKYDLKEFTQNLL